MKSLTGKVIVAQFAGNAMSRGRFLICDHDAMYLWLINLDWLVGGLFAVEPQYVDVLLSADGSNHAEETLFSLNAILNDASVVTSDKCRIAIHAARDKVADLLDHMSPPALRVFAPAEAACDVTVDEAVDNLPAEVAGEAPLVEFLFRRVCELSNWFDNAQGIMWSRTSLVEAVSGYVEGETGHSIDPNIKARVRDSLDL